MSSAFHRNPLKSDFAARFKTENLSSLAPRARVNRLLLVAFLALAWSGLIVFRLYSLQISDFERWQDWALKEHFKEVVVASERGPILDRNGKLMAVSVPAGSVYVRPNQAKKLSAQELELAVDKIAALLDLDRSFVKKKFTSAEPFVWLKRQIPRVQAQELSALALPGVGYIMESKRYYPYNQAASVLLGVVGMDGNGLSGLEARYENLLHTDHVKTLVTRDALGNVIQANPKSAEDFKLPKGVSLKLTLDASLQMIMDEELESGRQKANAKSAMAVMIDSDSGEVLALSQSPAINFNSNKKYSKSEMHNLLAETVFEPGSIMKPIVAAAALEKKVVSPAEIIDCEGGRFRFSSHIIKDVHPYKLISFSDVIIRSSNIGMTKIGARLGADTLHTYLSRFGFGKDSDLNLPGESSGIFRPVSSWARVDVATHSFGQGIAVTPLQMVRAMAAISNGGKLPTLSLVMNDTVLQSARIISEKTASQIREMLFGAVEDEHGTGKLARIEAIRVGGKTGTAQKARKDGRGYEPGAYMASFVGFADGAPLGLKKSLSLMVVIDEPRAKSIYGGTLAAPVFKRIMQRSMHLLAVQNELSSSPSRDTVKTYIKTVESIGSDKQNRL